LLWLRQGSVAAFGDVDAVMERYKAEQLGAGQTTLERAAM
jgi:hypothetical protein